MKDVRFDYDSNSFLCKSSDKDKDLEYKFEFYQKISQTDKIDYSRYVIELVINPYLNKESDVIKLQNAEGGIGYIFPISILESEDNLDKEYRGMHYYTYSAYMILLKRLEKIKDEQVFSKNFEDNICVFILDKTRIDKEDSLEKCIHSLRKWGYSYFEDHNNITPIPYYSNSIYKRNKRLKLNFTIPDLYNHKMVDYLLREYSKASSPLHRFIILYQIIEYLYEIEAKKEANIIIKKYSSDTITYNDFSSDLRALTSEKSKINKIFDRCGKLRLYQDFINEYTDLCTEISYSPNCSKDAIADQFYSFRNLLTHSYRIPHSHEEKLNRTIQASELLILEIVEKYPN